MGFPTSAIIRGSTFARAEVLCPTRRRREIRCDDSCTPPLVFSRHFAIPWLALTLDYRVPITIIPYHFSNITPSYSRLRSRSEQRKKV